MLIVALFRLPAFKGGNKCPTVTHPTGGKETTPSSNANQVSNLNRFRGQGQSLTDRHRSESANNNNSLPSSTGMYIIGMKYLYHLKTWTFYRQLFSANMEYYSGTSHIMERHFYICWSDHSAGTVKI